MARAADESACGAVIASGRWLVVEVMVASDAATAAGSHLYKDAMCCTNWLYADRSMGGMARAVAALPESRIPKEEVTSRRSLVLMAQMRSVGRRKTN